MSRHLVDPELAAGLDTNMPAYKLDAETLPTYRQMLLDMVAAIPKPTSEAMINVRRDERFVPGPDGSPDVRVLVYTPGDKGDAILPAILHIHGGGFVSGSADMSDPNSRSYAVEMNCVVVSVDYRLAPETPFPGPVEDCYAALLWLHSAAKELGIDPARIMIAGESAGAGLVAGLCQLGAGSRRGDAACSNISPSRCSTIAALTAITRTLAILAGRAIITALAGTRCWAARTRFRLIARQRPLKTCQACPPPIFTSARLICFWRSRLTMPAA